MLEKRINSSRIFAKKSEKIFEFGKYVLSKINHIVGTQVELNFFPNTMVKLF